VNNEQALKEAKLQLEYLEARRDEYSRMLHRFDSLKSEQYYAHWEKIQTIDDNIFEAKKRITSLQTHPTCYININLIDEQDEINFTNARVMFINEPGVEYSYLFIENPLRGISAPAYSGLQLKYLFTRGKSYVTLGALNAVNRSKEDTLSFSNFYNIAFGQ